jgi:hypothetical protein
MEHLELQFKRVLKEMCKSKICILRRKVTVERERERERERE